MKTLAIILCFALIGCKNGGEPSSEDLANISPESDIRAPEMLVKGRYIKDGITHPTDFGDVIETNNNQYVRGTWENGTFMYEEGTFRVEQKQDGTDHEGKPIVRNFIVFTPSLFSPSDCYDLVEYEKVYNWTENGQIATQWIYFGILKDTNFHMSDIDYDHPHSVANQQDSLAAGCL